MNKLNGLHKLLKVGAAIAAIATLVTGTAACGSANASGSGDQNTVVVGTSNDAPLAYLDASGNLTGIDGDIMMAIAKVNGWKVENQVTGFSTLIESLNTNKIDILNDSMMITPEREKKASFTPFYVLSDAIVVKASETGVKGYDDIKGKSVGTVTGTTYADFLNTLSPGNVKLFDSQATMLQAISNGDVYAAVTDQPVAAYGIKQNASLGLRMVNPAQPHFQNKVGPAVRLDDKDRLAKIQSGLKTIKDSGEYKKIMEKWDMPASSYID